MLRPSTANGIRSRWNHAVRRAWARTQTLGRDAVRLLRAAGRAPPSARRDLLLRQAGENAAAAELLRWERELTLLRYYGVRGYWREKKLVSSLVPSFQLFSSSGTTEHGASSSPTSSTSNSSTAQQPESTDTAASTSEAAKKPRVAKVPFMITARMRQDLMEQLGYETTEIAALTPLEAMLILEHKVRPYETVKLPELLKAYEAEQRRVAEEAAEEHRKQQQAAELERRKEAEAQAAATAKRVQSEQQQQQQQQVVSELPVPQTAELSAAEAVLVEAPFAAEPVDNTAGGTTWHQVVEISPTASPDDPPHVVGMFLDPKEAEFARGVHQDLANERADEKSKKSNQQQQQQQQQQSSRISSKFEIRTVVKD